MNSKIKSNQRKAFMVLLASTTTLGLLLYSLTAYLGSDINILIGIAIFTLITPWVLYYKSDSIVIKTTGARPATENENKQLINIVEELALATNLPVPKLYVVDDDAPNAFATGRNPSKGVIAVTTGLLSKLDRESQQGVIAHEMAHIQNRDTLVGTIVATITTLILFISDLGLRIAIGGRKSKGSASPLIFLALLAVVLAPIGAVILRATHSRAREALADMTAVKITRNPTGLRKALEALAADNTEIKKVSPASSALWIEEPNPRNKNNKPNFISRLYATHPPIEERIEALYELEKNQG
jgi:heat shock protein HtpX